MIKRLLYLAFVRLPTEKAHGLQIVKTCEALARSGIEVTLIIPSRTTAIKESPFEYYKVEKNFALEVAQTPDFVALGFFGYLFSSLWFSEAVKWRPIFWEVDVVYSRDAWVLLQYVLLGRKFVFEAHRKPSFLDRVVARRAFRVITITKSLKKVFIAAGVSKEKIIVAHDGVEPTLTPPRVRTPGAPLVVYAGSQKPGKGVETVEAARTLIPGVEVRIVTGQNPSTAQAALSEADVVLVPNSAKFESWALYTSPMKLFEALQSGARVVVSDVPAIREVVDETVAYFFTPDDPQSLAGTVQKALADPDAAQKIAAAQALARTYTWDERAKIIIQQIF